jgi:rhodanese-related sulfurtransferase
VEGGHDHMEPEELADRLSRGEPGLVVVDVRSAEEFQAFHLRGAVNVSLAQLAKFLAPHKNTGIIVLYSNGMTHPAQARDSLYRQGFRNVFILTDGLKGFLERCLMPVSLRSEPVLPQTAARINTWRAFFLSQGKEPQAGPASAPAAAAHPSQ